MTKIPRLLVAIALSTVSTLAVRAPAAYALADGDTLACQLGGGNSISLTMRLTQQGDTFALVGQWDDASLSPHLPVYGAALVDPNFDIVGGLTYVGFAPRPLPRAPFGTLPRGVHVQFRLAPSEVRGFDLAGHWADDRATNGTMGCNTTPAAP